MGCLIISLFGCDFARCRQLAAVCLPPDAVLCGGASVNAVLAQFVYTVKQQTIDARAARTAARAHPISDGARYLERIWRGCGSAGELRREVSPLTR